ncbi:hypothetical protein Zmor_024561 [Zophobas morio]|uniref:Uncharacterized protein n=1 Tax=Zophobas morio TaxID=2755281 RepID=A0AA38I0W9_9CUCU|nr:hypothetical protein Zmor_024561 [Zophobas morio]
MEKSPKVEDIILEEIVEGLKTMKNGKATRHDRVTPKMIKLMSELRQTLTRRGIPKYILEAVKNLYKITRNYVKTNNMGSEEFGTKKGLRQRQS